MIIIDEFTSLSVSNRRRKELRSKRDGLCLKCPARAVNANYCEEHRQQVNKRSREYLRRRRGYYGRNFGAESYSY